MSSRDFNDWLNTFRSSINGYRYYTDFETVYRKAEENKIEINILNSLIGSKNIKEEFLKILHDYPNCIKAVPILLAVRESEMYCQDERGAVIYRFNKMTQTPEEYAYFMEQTGLFDLLENHLISNLYDYVLGVEVGLGSNGRKNRGGHQMEYLVEKYIQAAGFVKDVTYFKEMYLNEIEEKWGVDLSSISADGTTTKRWDYVIKTATTIYVIECNFYTSGGSKLNETARSYKMITEESKDIPNVQFVWFTDGGGWKSAKRGLHETFDVLDYMFNINDLENNIIVEKFK